MLYCYACLGYSIFCWRRRAITFDFCIIGHWVSNGQFDLCIIWHWILNGRLAIHTTCIIQRQEHVCCLAFCDTGSFSCLRVCPFCWCLTFLFQFLSLWKWQKETFNIKEYKNTAPRTISHAYFNTICKTTRIYIIPVQNFTY